MSTAMTGLPCPQHAQDQRIVFRAEDFVHHVQFGRVKNALDVAG